MAVIRKDFIPASLPPADEGPRAAYQEIAAIRDATRRLVGAGDLEAAGQRFVEYWVGAGAWANTPAAARATIAAGMRKVRFEWANGFDWAFPVGRLSRLSMPILLLTGSRSTAAARGVVRLLHGLLPGAERIELPELGHMGPVTHPEVVNEAVAAFLARTQGGGTEAGPRAD